MVSATKNSNKLAHKLFETLQQHKQTVGFAESCTSGKLSAELGSISGVSQVYLGSVVSYANQVKTDLLGVSRDVLMNEGAVSETVALQMAHGARKVLKVDWAVSITGIAGPTGGTPEKPVGTVWFAVVGSGTSGVVEKSQKKLFKGDREHIQLASVEFALEFLLKNLK